MSDFPLPLEADVDSIVYAIEKVQERARKGICQNPRALASRVHNQVQIIVKMAKAIPALHPFHLQAQAQFWEASLGAFGEPATLVEIRTDKILVTRGKPWESILNGAVTLHLLEF